MQTTPNPLRSIGDALKEIRHRFEDILSPQQPDAPVENKEESASQSQIQYIQPEDVDHDMQALGPAGEEQTAKLNQLTLIDDETTSNDGRAMDVDIPLPAEESQMLLSQPPSQVNNSASEQRNDVEAAIVQGTLGQTLGEDEKNDDHVVEMQLRSRQVADYPDEDAEQLWQSYESLTHDLAYALCEQLRLILEPTLATRLTGVARVFHSPLQQRCQLSRCLSAHVIMACHHLQISPNTNSLPGYIVRTALSTFSRSTAKNVLDFCSNINRISQMEPGTFKPKPGVTARISLQSVSGAYLILPESSIHYIALITELCKLSPSTVGPAVGKSIHKLYNPTLLIFNRHLASLPFDKLPG